jgi:hypothetical protein
MSVSRLVITDNIPFYIVGFSNVKPNGAILNGYYISYVFIYTGESKCLFCFLHSQGYTVAADFIIFLDISIFRDFFF